jgi:putative FmdB family regulatory protein
MPVYEWKCQGCGREEDVLAAVKDRNLPRSCACGWKMARKVSLVHVENFSPYFDEGLGCDIESPSHRRRVMKELGVIEAGDRVGGAINFDKHAPSHVGRLPVQGRQRKLRLVSDPVVSTVGADDKIEFQSRWSELPGTP